MELISMECKYIVLFHTKKLVDVNLTGKSCMVFFIFSAINIYVHTRSFIKRDTVFHLKN